MSDAQHQALVLIWPKNSLCVCLWLPFMTKIHITSLPFKKEVML